MGTVIAILGLLVSVATAVVGYRQGHRAERAQRLREEREEQARRRREEQAERADRIRQASWISSYVHADGRRVTVFNGSSQPISDLRVSTGDELLWPDGVRLLAPGGFSEFVLFSAGAGHGLDPASLSVEFTDVAGRAWRRTAGGKLHERLSPQGAPPQWGPAITPLVEPFQSPRPDAGRTYTGGGPVPPPPAAQRPTGPPSGQLSPAPPPAGAAGGRRRAAVSWRSLFVLGCLGAAAALAYLVARLV